MIECDKYFLHIPWSFHTQSIQNSMYSAKITFSILQVRWLRVGLLQLPLTLILPISSAHTVQSVTKSCFLIPPLSTASPRPLLTTWLTIPVNQVINYLVGMYCIFHLCWCLRSLPHISKPPACPHLTPPSHDSQSNLNPSLSLSYLKSFHDSPLHLESCAHCTIWFISISIICPFFSQTMSDSLKVIQIDAICLPDPPLHVFRLWPEIPFSSC